MLERHRREAGRSSGSTRWLPRLIGAGIALCAVAVPVAWASHQFTDVPDGHQFHEEISAIAVAGITGGKTCDPPGTPATYCPTENVNRQAMAAFLRRGLGRAVISGGTGLALTSTFETVMTTNIPAGGVPGGTGYVVALGDLNVRAAAGSLSSAVAVEYRLTTPSTVGDPTPNILTLHPAPVVSAQTGSKSHRFQVPTGELFTVHLQARIAAAEPTDASDVVVQLANLTLVYVPFGG